MTNEDIIRMAKQAGLRRHQENLMSNPPQIRFFYEGNEENIECFAALVAAAEREECIGDCNAEASAEGIAQRIIERIRARGQS